MGGWIKTFYMPMFFLISGMFFKPVQLKKKIKRLTVPYFCFYALAFVVYVLKACVKNENIDWGSLYIPFVGGTRDYQNTPLWFLMSLGEITLLSYFVVRKYNRTMALISSFIVAFLASRLHEYTTSIPYYFDVSLICFPFFLMGYYFGISLTQKRNVIYPIIMIAISLGLYFIKPVFTNVSTNYLPQGFILFFLVSVCATIGIIGLCHVIKGHFVYVIEFWGRNSLVILCTHMIFMTIDSVCLSLIPKVLYAALISFALIMFVESGVVLFINRYGKFALGK